MLPLSGFFQVGYVTNDLDRALEVYAKSFGAPNFLTFDTAKANPRGRHPSRVGLAWIGSTQIELIEPRDADHPLYGEALPKDGFGINVHHHGYNLYGEAEWKSVMDELARQEIRIASHTVVDDVLELVYADTRKQLGHYSEYIWRQPKGWKFMIEDVPRNDPPGHRL
jgi:hypothetical protein